MILLYVLVPTCISYKRTNLRNRVVDLAYLLAESTRYANTFVNERI